MENRPKLYATAAFLAGILVTLGFKDFYPELEFRFWKRRAANRTLVGAGLHDDDHIDLEDHEKDVNGVIKVPEGIEASIGNTPLFKIKSLSEETGCDILAKAEVYFCSTRYLLNYPNCADSSSMGAVEVLRTE